MSGLETAIRNALERSDRANPEIRARIYQSARQALEAGLRKQDVTDVDIVSAQRQRLEATIRAVEGEERARLHAGIVPPDAEMLRPPAGRAAPPQDVPPPRRAEPVAPAGPEVRGETRGRPAAPMRDEPDGDLGDMRAGPADHLGADHPGDDQF